MFDPKPAEDLAALARDCRELAEHFRSDLSGRLVLPPEVVEHGLVALLGCGHLLLEGNPGMGKQSFARHLAGAFGLSFGSVPLTPDLGADELIGQLAADRGQQVEDPLSDDPAESSEPTGNESGAAGAFGVVYAEDVEKASARTRAVLFDRMRQWGASPSTCSLEAPSMVIASCSPSPPAAPFQLDLGHLDRFLMKTSIRYPTAEEEWRIARTCQRQSSPARPLVSRSELAAFRRGAAAMEMPESVTAYAWALVRATRPGNELAPDFVERWIKLGISPRGLTALIAAAKARALLRGRPEPTRKDVAAVAFPSLGHRLTGNEESEAANLSSDRLVGILLEAVPPDGQYDTPESDSSL